MMDYTRLWPTLIPVLGLLIDQFSGTITAYLAAHPTAALLAVTIVTALANIIRSPRQP